MGFFTHKDHIPQLQHMKVQGSAPQLWAKACASQDLYEHERIHSSEPLVLLVRQMQKDMKEQGTRQLLQVIEKGTQSPQQSQLVL